MNSKCLIPYGSSVYRFCQNDCEIVNIFVLFLVHLYGKVSLPIFLDQICIELKLRTEISHFQYFLNIFRNIRGLKKNG